MESTTGTNSRNNVVHSAASMSIATRFDLVCVIGQMNIKEERTTSRNCQFGLICTAL